MLHLRKGRYIARSASGQNDLARVHALRKLCFAGDAKAAGTDQYDRICTQILIEEVATGSLVSCFRMFPVANGTALSKSYSFQFYDLAAFAHFQHPMAELGRFCIHPAHHDPDILRIAWGALTQWVDAAGVRMLFGCASFMGDDAALHLDAFSLLHRKHQAPAQWQPGPKAAEVFDFTEGLRNHAIDPNRARSGIPPLLRTYLLMGGWVSDHAVFDRDMGTMHVFTAVEIDAIPATRARLLRAVAE